MTTRVRELTGRGAPVVLLLLLWILAARLFEERRVVPTPWAVARAFAHDLPVYPANLSVTLTNAFVGYLFGNLLAVAAAVLFVQVLWMERLLLRIAVASFCVPLVAITPILTVVLPGDAPKQVLAGLSVFFTTLVSCILGLRSSPASTHDVIRSMGGSGWTELLKIRLWSMLPGLFAGLQIAAPAALLGTILGEYLGSASGLGVLLVQSQSSFEVPRTWATALLMSALSALVFTLAGLLGRRLTPWVGRDVTTSTGVAAEAGRTSVPVALLGVLGSVVIVCAGWWGLIRAFDLSPYFAKTPLDVWNHLVTAADAAENRSYVLSGLGITVRDAGIGYLIGTALACLLAVAVMQWPLVERFFMPLAITLRSVPLVAMTPLLALVFGRGLLGVTVIVSVVTFFPTLVSVVAALRSAPAIACDVVRSMGGSSVTVTAKVRLLHAVPAVFASARIAVPGAIAGATLAEWLATGEGIGSMLVKDFAASQFNDMWSETVVVITLSVLAYAVVSAAERFVARRMGTVS
ncbi:ABC transporter permease [Kineosporia succinea]|uniref:ABC-type nitrate/sulfonate/bicarbonate transport system permease component n=1 Tax=Kineosporia succinea TaxID=84632 RepID=A0ABT9P2L3_9ACTN|nr:ABC transporter permease subunit [Kineosporia succinea]MDP9826926.1 ABC-type nitrate/sulfonate/bicarbonate transport system permease component [Kineosporia succinea]